MERGTPKQRVERLLRLMSTRMPWHLAAKAITQAGLHTARGWDETIGTFRDAPLNDATVTKAEGKLRDAFVWHTYVGNKQVTWYRISALNQDWQKRIKNWTGSFDSAGLARRLQKKWTPPDAVPFDQPTLGAMVDKPPELLSADANRGTVYFQFFNVRAYSQQEVIDLDNLTAQDRTRLGGYSELIGVRRRHVPCFDTVVIDPQNDSLELRIDFLPGFSSEQQEQGAGAVIAAFNDVAVSQLTIAPLGVGIVNFFPAINKLYVDKDAGRVTTLGFAATSDDTSSNNTGKILRKPTQDLRKDKFHIGGRGNVKFVQPYHVGVTWPSASGMGSLELDIKGHVKMLYTANAAVEVSSFVGCADGRDFEFLRAQLTAHL